MPRTWIDWESGWTLWRIQDTTSFAGKASSSHWESRCGRNRLRTGCLCTFCGQVLLNIRCLREKYGGPGWRNAYYDAIVRFEMERLQRSVRD